MKKNAIITIGNNTHEIANKALNENLTKMIQAMSTANKSAWTYAYHLNKIIETECFAEDFSTITKFAEFIGLSKASVSQYTNAIRFAKSVGRIDCIIDGKLTNDFMKIEFSIGNAYLLSKIDDYKMFLEWIFDNDISEDEVFKMSNRQLKSLINDYKHRNDVKPEDTDTTEKPEDTDTTEKPTKTEVIDAIVDYIIEYNIMLNEIGTELAKRNNK